MGLIILKKAVNNENGDWIMDEHIDVKDHIEWF
jgi:hypothetical protein